MNLTRTNWPKGWEPSSDAVNGDPNGLLRMDNLRLDKEGVVGLVDGIQATGAGFPDFVSAMYSRMIQGDQEYVWVASGIPANSIQRTINLAPQASLVVGGGGSPSDRCFFGDALGHVFAVAGTLRTKDPIFDNPIPLGLLTPVKGNGDRPTGVVNSQPTLLVPAPNNPVEGAGGPVSGRTAVTLTVDSNTLEGSLVTTTNFKLDTTAIGSGTADDIGTDLIQFPFTVQDQPANVIDKIELDFLLDGTPSDPSTYQNYYSYTWLPGGIQGGVNTQTILTANRADFSRYGNDQTLNWGVVIGVRLLVNSRVVCTCGFDDIKFIGGALGQLNGVYEYIQVSVADNGTYLGKSPASPPAVNTVNVGTKTTTTTNFTVINGSVTLTPIRTDPYATEYRFYRKSVADIGIDPNTGTSLNKSFLDKYYYVGKTSGSSFTDSLSDEYVLQLNADGSLLPNLYLQTLNTRDAVNGLQETIYGIEGIYNERMLYMGAAFIYLSDKLNPDAVDTRFTLKPSGDSNEKNLWLKRLTNNVIILATNKTTYEISGTLNELPDGSIDANIINLGESHPPLSFEVANFNGGLFYVGSDGLRVTTGSNSVNVSPQLRHLFQNTKVFPNSVGRHGIPGVAIYSGVGVNYGVAAAHQKIYFTCPLTDGTRRLFVYDTVTKTYELRFTDPVTVFSTQADELLAGYANGSVYIIDYQQASGGGLGSYSFTLRTVFDANGQPRNRKDTFTLKLKMDTGSAPVSVSMQKDGIGVSDTDEPNWIVLGQYSSDGTTYTYIDISRADLSLGFRYAIQIQGQAVSTFKLYELTIEYEPRPEQLDYLRILPTNAGTISRKRWTAYAFVIDTLGNNIQFTPYLDNVAWTTTETFSTGTKLTHVFYFAAEAISTDIGGIISGGVFEFYGVDLGECVSEKLPPPVQYLVIPPDNYGTPNRKRHTSYKFQILTRGRNVQFTPQVDGTTYTPATYNTTEKQTVEYYFNPSVDGDVVGIDIGGTLQALTSNPFEFYGSIRPQTVEVLPDRLEYLRIPNSNFGIPSKKRIRTLPLVIDTYGTDVTFTPIVDSIAGTPQTLNTDGKRTAFYYFNSDVFGVDFGGIIQTPYGQPFEFYEMLRPEDVEMLPTGKLMDQLGPMQFDKIGKLFGFRVRVIPTGTTNAIPWALYDDYSPVSPTLSNPLISGSLQVYPNYDDVYEVQFPKNVNATVCRLVLGPTADPFHRYSVMVKVQTSGMQSESKWIPIR